MLTRNKFEIGGFVLASMVLAFLYGFASHGFDLFPSDILESASRQARVVWSQAPWTPPRYTTQRVYNQKGVRVQDRQRVQPGATLIASGWQDFDWKPGLKLISSDGRTLHEWKVDPQEVFSDTSFPASRPPNAVHGSYLFPTGDVLVNIARWGLARLDACGNVRWRLAKGNHHSITRTDGGPFWVPSLIYPSDSLYGNYSGINSPTPQNGIMKVRSNGEVIKEINILSIIYENQYERYIVKSDRLDVNSDLTHLNDVEPLPDSIASEYPLFGSGDLLVSLPRLSLVFVFDPSTRNILWGTTDHFISQHDPDFVGDGWIGIFDNNTDGTKRGQLLGGSRIVAVRPHTGANRVLFPTDRSDDFYTSVQGKWQKLRNGNLLLTESQAGRVVEVAPDGRTVWEWIARPYNESRIPEVTEGTRYSLTPSQIQSWPCSPGETTGE